MRDTDDDAAAKARRQRFATVIEELLDRAKRERGWAATDVAQRAGVGRATIDRWKHDRLAADPRPAQVNAVYAAVGADPEPAYRALQWGRYSAEQPEPPPMHPAIADLLAKLNDPSVPEEEKRDVIRTVEWLSSRGSPPDPPATRNQRAG